MAFTPEQQAEIDKARSEIAAEYDIQSHKFREWIKSNPVRNANIIGWIVAIVFYGLGNYGPHLLKVLGG